MPAAPFGGQSNGKALIFLFPTGSVANNTKIALLLYQERAEGGLDADGRRLLPDHPEVPRRNADGGVSVGGSVQSLGRGRPVAAAPRALAQRKVVPGGAPP